MLKLIKSKSIIDGTDREPIQNGCILIKDGVIEGVGSLESLGQVSPDIQVIEHSDYYILPGLINSHTHLSIIPAEGNQMAQMSLPAATNVLRSIPNINKDLYSGVTTMRIMGEEHYIDIDIKDAINKKLIQGPRMSVCGVGIVATNGHGVAITVSDGEEEVRKLSRRNLARGADFLKIFITGGASSIKSSLDFCGYTEEEVTAVVEEAKRSGTYVAAHAYGGRGVDLCISQGVRTIEHGAFINERQLYEIIKKDMWIVGTFSILYHPTGIEQSDFKIPAIKDKVLKAREVIRENFSKIIKSGANIAVGTDSMHGLISYELECLVDFGASNKQAVLAATKNAAALCKLDDKVGTLEKGKLADFIVLEQDPLCDIRSLKNIKYVYKEGERVLIP